MNNWRLLAIRCLLLVTAVTGLGACSSMHNVKSEEPEKYILGDNATDARYFYTRSGLRLFGQWWLPAERPRAVILLVHGTVFHSGFYSPWANELTKNGYAVFGIDLRGWGQSQGYGRRGSVGSYDEYVEDVTLARREIRKRFPNIPVYLQGESLGGAVVLMANMMDKVSSDGLIVNAPAVKPNPSALVGIPVPDKLMSFGMWAVSQADAVAPEFPSLPILKPFVGRVMADKEARERFNTDPNATRTALPLSYISAIQNASERLQENINNIRSPMIILQGTKDVLVPESSSQFLYDNIQSQDKTLRVYKGMRHATLHDSDKRAVWDDIISWLDNHADQALAARKLLPDETEISAADEVEPAVEKAAYRPKYPKLTMTTTRN
ncbi:alpha/beta hydrolase [Agitococcus lubricus]|uniref:Acylglycerol lipase n=1 Tax=Agitococcus lubricus TaxID=1077255 RepID=A0A2T5J3C2_9GAMM|nr:alpha/beta hydrolase [Agitococcus lubricus]PTQ91076.1 acylglycerol lipase [Agitococcus lubricus]